MTGYDWIIFHIWDVILPIDSYFSEGWLHHQPAMSFFGWFFSHPQTSLLFYVILFRLPREDSVLSWCIKWNCSCTRVGQPGAIPNTSCEFLKFDSVAIWVAQKFQDVPGIRVYVWGHMGVYQWKFQDPKLEVLYHIRPYFGGYISLFWGNSHWVYVSICQPHIGHVIPDHLDDFDQLCGLTSPINRLEDRHRVYIIPMKFLWKSPVNVLI